MSFLLHDPEGSPWILFTGDALFSGDAGRVDLMGEDRLEEMAGHLYDSIFEKILPLGDGIILCPAHGSGSVCGGEIAERNWTTIGLEKQLNPKLQVRSKSEFIERHAKMLERPPYFRKTEHLNLVGPEVLNRLPALRPLQAGAFGAAASTAQIIDTRDQASFGAAHVPGSLSIWKEILPNFAGWFLDYENPILVVCEAQDRETLVRMLVRLGYDRFAGYLEGGVVGWALAGKDLSTIATPDQGEFAAMLGSDAPPFVLDVRGKDEIKGWELQHGMRIHLTELLAYLDEIPKDRKIAPMCTSGYRSMLAASLLEKAGWHHLSVPIGGLKAWIANRFDMVL
jgi:hydroxyacylglutathione hydrolase